MSINIDTSSIQQQIDSTKQDEQLFLKDQENKEKVSKAKHELHKEMTKAAYAAKHGHAMGDQETHGSSKVPTGHAALFLALEEQINNNLLDMSSHSQALNNMTPEMKRQGDIYNQLTSEQDDLANMDPSLLNAKSSALKAELMNATTSTDLLSTKASAESHYMTNDAAQNSALTGIGSFLVQAVIDKQGNYSRA